MSCNRGVLCGGIIEDSCTATVEADLCPVTAIICAIEQFLPRIVAPVARIEWLSVDL